MLQMNSYCKVLPFKKKNQRVIFKDGQALTLKLDMYIITLYASTLENLII